MMVVFFLYFLGEFVVEAEPGKWIDYARTGKMSEDRYILIQHTGEKGTYDQGTDVLVLNGQGERLYIMPEAENAWVIRNGLMGDKDFLIFQNRIDPIWHLWHPIYGVRPLEGQPNLGRRGLFSMNVSRQGRLYFLSKYEDGIEIEEIEFTASESSELFTNESISFSHQSHRLEGLPDIFAWSGGFMLHFPFTPNGGQPSTFFRYTFDAEIPDRFRQIDLGLPFTSMNYHEGWFSLSGWAKEGSYLALHDGKRVRLRIPYDKSPVRQAFSDFIAAFDRGAVAVEGTRMRYLREGKLFELDLGVSRFNTYRAAGSWSDLKGWTRPDKDTLVEVSAEVFKVLKVNPIRGKGLVLMNSIDIPEHYLGLEKPSVDRIFRKKEL